MCGCTVLNTLLLSKGLSDDVKYNLIVIQVLQDAV